MADFDPDAFLAGGTAVAEPPAFDPDAFLAEPEPFDPDAFLAAAPPATLPPGDPSALAPAASGGGDHTGDQAAAGVANAVTPAGHPDRIEEATPPDRATVAAEVQGLVTYGTPVSQRVQRVIDAERLQRDGPPKPILGSDPNFSLITKANPNALSPSIIEAETAGNTVETMEQMGRFAVGGASSGTAEIVGGGAGFTNEFLFQARERQAAKEKNEKLILDLGKKKSFDDALRDAGHDDNRGLKILEAKRLVDSGEYRSGSEEATLRSARYDLAEIKHYENLVRPYSQPLTNFQDLSSLAAEESKTFFGQDPARQEEFLMQLAQGGGSLPPYIASGMVGGAPLSMVVGALQTAQSEYDSAVAAGHPELAQKAFENGLMIGATEGLGIGEGPSKPAKDFAQKIVKVLSAQAREGGQEWVQQTLSNLNANTGAGYDPKRGTFEGSGQAGLIGAVLGGGVETIGELRGEGVAADPNSAEAETIEFERQRAEAIAAANALKEQAAAAAQTMPAAAEEAAKLAEAIEQQAAAQPAPKDEPAAETATPSAESQPAPSETAPAETAAAPVEDTTPDPTLSRVDALEAALADEPVVETTPAPEGNVTAASEPVPQRPDSAEPTEATTAAETAEPVVPQQRVVEDRLGAIEKELEDGNETGQPALRIVPAPNGRVQIVDAADNRVGRRTYENEANASQAMSKIGKRSTFGIPPSVDGNDIIDAIIEQGGINISGLSLEERNNLFPHRGIWRNALTTDNSELTPDEVARLLAPSEENAAAGIQSYGDGDQRTLFDLIDKAVQSRRRMRDQGKAQARNQKADERRIKAFQKAVLKPRKGVTGTPVGQMKTGDEIVAAGERFVMTDLDPDTGAITLEDGDAFGTQIVEDGQILHGEFKAGETDALADWPEKVESTDVDTLRQAEEYAKDQGIIDERESSPDSLPQSAPERDADQEGQKRDAGATPAGAGAPAKETPLDRARRVVAERQQDLELAREEGDTELVESLGRVLGKLRKDLAALEKAATEPAAESDPSAQVELWQRTRDAVGNMFAKHRQAVRDAVKAGKPVPDEVLYEYRGAAWADDEIERRSEAENEQVKTKAAKKTQNENTPLSTATPEKTASKETSVPKNEPASAPSVPSASGEEQVAPKLTEGQDQGALLTGETANTGTTANVTNEEGGTLVRLGGQVVAKLNQNAKGEFTPELNENGQKLTAEQKTTVAQAAKDYTKTWRAAEVRRLAAKPKAAADLTTQLDMLESGRSESPLFEQKPDKVEQFLDDTIDKLKSKPGELFSDPLFIQSVGKPALRAALQVFRATYTATKNVAQAIADAVAHLRANVPNINEAKARTFFEEAMGVVVEQPAEDVASKAGGEQASVPPPKPPIELPKQSGDLPSTTAAYNAETDKLLARGGFEPIEGPARKALGTSWDEAQAQVASDTTRGSRLVAELNENPRTLKDDVESGVLLHELATRKAEQVAAQEALFAADAAGDPDAIADAKGRLSKARDAVFEAITAAKVTGTAWGRAGRFRQVHIDQDYSLVAMEAAWRAEVNGGKPLTEDQTKLIAELHQKIADSEAKIAALEAKAAELEAQRVFDQVVKEAKAEASTARTVGKRVRNFLHEQAAAAKARIIARRGKLFSTVDPLNIAGLADEAIIGADKIASGLSKFADWSKSMLADFGARLEPYLSALFDKSQALHNEVAGQMRAKSKPKKGPKADPTEPTTQATPEQVLASDKAGAPLDPRLVFDLARAHVNAGVEGMEAVMAAVHADLLPNHPDLAVRDVRDAFSGYGKVTYPSREEDLTKLREYRTLARLTSQLEDAERRLAPLKTGPQRDKASQAVRDLTKRVKETMRRLGIESVSPAEQLRTSLDAVKARLRNQIEDLEKQIATRMKPEGKTPIPYDTEATALRAERDRLAGIAEEIFGKPELTDEQRIAAATKALDRAIAEEDALLKQGILKRPKKESKTPSTPELEAKRAMLDSMRDLRRELADAAEPKASPEERALAAALKTARASIERYDELLKSGKLTPEQRAQRFTPTAELESLWNERNALRDLVSELRAAERPKQSPEEAARKAALKSADKRIAELDRRLREGDFSKPARQPGKADQFADVASKRAEAKALADLYRELEKAQQPKRTPEEIQLARDKKLIAKRTAELERRVREGDYAPKPKKEPVMDAEKRDLLFENAKAKERYNVGLFEARQKARSTGRKIFDGIREALNASRSVLTSFDVSAVLRQGNFIAFAHPVRAGKSILPMLKAALSAKVALEIDHNIRDRPNAELYAKSKLFLSDQNDMSLQKQEEAFMSRWTARSEMQAGEPVKNALRKAKNFTTAPVRASSRAYTSFLNLLRADSFDAMAATLSRDGNVLSPEEAKAIASFVNIATGRGKIEGRIGSLDLGQTATTLNSFFFAPRWVISRFQLLAGQPLYGGNKRTRKLIAQEYGRFLAGAAVVYALASLATGDDDEDWSDKLNIFRNIDLDPTSSDFLKIRFGKTRLDPLGGLIQSTVFGARIGDAIHRFATDSQEKKPDYGTGGDALGRFLRSKLAPFPGAVWDMLDRKDVVGHPITREDAALKMVTPISMGDILKTMEEQGIAQGTALSLLSLLGAGLQTYADRKR